MTQAAVCLPVSGIHPSIWFYIIAKQPFPRTTLSVRRTMKAAIQNRENEREKKNIFLCVLSALLCVRAFTMISASRCQWRIEFERN